MGDMSLELVELPRWTNAACSDAHWRVLRDPAAPQTLESWPRTDPLRHSQALRWHCRANRPAAL